MDGDDTDLRFPPDLSAPAAPEPLWREAAGEALRAERLRQGRTLRQVAERAGISAQYLTEMERGVKEPSSEMLESVCGALGLRLSDLLAASFTVIRLGTATGSLIPFGPSAGPMTGPRIDGGALGRRTDAMLMVA